MNMSIQHNKKAITKFTKRLETISALQVLGKLEAPRGRSRAQIKQPNADETFEVLIVQLQISVIPRQIDISKPKIV